MPYIQPRPVTIATIRSLGDADCMKLRDYAGLSPEQRSQIAALVADHRTLERALRHWLSQSPPVDVADVVIQDEFTHDVIVPTPDGLTLVYEAT